MSTTPIWPIEGVALDSTGDLVDGSLGDLIQDLAANINTQVAVYPTLANGEDVVSANADWTLGVFAQIVPASTIGSDFHIHGIIIEALNRDAVFELVLYYGGSDVEVARMRWAQTGGFFGNMFLDTITGVQIPADSRVRAKLASSNGAAEIATARISLRYAVYGG